MEVLGLDLGTVDCLKLGDHCYVTREFLSDKGHIEILISKPMSRPVLFLSRYAGVLFIMTVNVSYLIAGTWHPKPET